MKGVGYLFFQDMSDDTSGMGHLVLNRSSWVISVSSSQRCDNQHASSDDLSSQDGCGASAFSSDPIHGVTPRAHFHSDAPHCDDDSDCATTASDDPVLEDPASPTSSVGGSECHECLSYILPYRFTAQLEVAPPSLSIIPSGPSNLFQMRPRHIPRRLRRPARQKISPRGYGRPSRRRVRRVFETFCAGTCGGCAA
jgi:hypothetical protein